MSPEARARIAEAAEGNPLFVEQMAAMAAEAGEGASLAVPPTIKALLAARLDRLEPDERAVIERGLFDASKARDQWCAARFDEHVVQSQAHEVRIPNLLEKRFRCHSNLPTRVIPRVRSCYRAPVVLPSPRCHPERSEG